MALVENHDLTRTGILTLWRVSEIEVLGMAANATEGLREKLNDSAGFPSESARSWGASRLVGNPSDWADWRGFP